MTFYKENDNLYLNVVFNHNSLQGQADTLAEYNVTKTIPILDKCSDFYCSIVRFDIPLNSIPLFIMPIVPNQGNPNLTPMTIQINYQGNVFVQNLIYSPTNTIYPAPTQNQVTQVITPYYYVYTFQNMLDSLNAALQLAYTAFITAFPGAPQATPATAPFFIFNPISQLISLISSIAWTTVGANQALISVNNFMLNYLSGFQVIADPNFLFHFVIENLNNNGYPTNTYPTPPAYVQITQNYDTTVLWVSLRKLLVVTNTIPIANEYVPSYNTTTGQQNAVANSMPILTDFVPAIDFANESRSVAYYIPTAQYRLVDMINDLPLYKIDLRIYWEDKVGNLYPLTISPFQQASIKIAFLRKSLYKTNTSQLQGPLQNNRYF